MKLQQLFSDNEIALMTPKQKRYAKEMLINLTKIETYLNKFGKMFFNNKKAIQIKIEKK